MNKGKVFLVGAGPGDFGLLTIKGLESIKNADVIVYDRLVNKRFISFAKAGAELIYAGKENASGGHIQTKINETLVGKASEGKFVVRLKGGDPFVFGRGGEEIDELIKFGIEFEIVPGVTSAISGPAYAGIPVTHRDISSELHIFTGHSKDGKPDLNFENISKLRGTLVFLMGVENLNIITGELEKYGKDEKTPVGVIENATTGRQRIITGNIGDIVDKIMANNIKPPSIIVIGEVVKLSEKFGWFNKKKLSGKKILVTRTKNQAFEFSNELYDLGAEPVELPFIDIVEKKMDIDLNLIKKYSVIIFNSSNAVRCFINNIDDLRILSGIKIGVVGSGTEKELERYKMIYDFMPDKFMVKEAVKESVKFTKNGDCILIITSNISPVNTEELKKEYGINFDKLQIYETVKLKRSKEELTEIFNQEIDMITFMSGSTVESFFENISGDYKNELKKIKFASIGPETTRAIEKFGFKADIEAKEYSQKGLIEEIVYYYGREIL